MMKLNSKQKKAFTLIELLIVIAIIGILFIVLVSKVDFATDKAKASGVQTDFRSFQAAFEMVSKENAGFNTFGWDTGDSNGNRVRDSVDVGDTDEDGVYDDGETWTGRKKYLETWTGCYTLINPGNENDYSAIFDLETAINHNLDPKLHIMIANDGVITMANGHKDPWSIQYHGRYITNASADAAAKWNTDASMTGSAGDNMDRGAILMYSNGANQKFGTKVKIEGGVVTATVSQIDANTPDNNKMGADDYVLAVVYTYTNGYGETAVITEGFSNNQQFLTGNGGNVNNAVVPGITPPVGGGAGSLPTPNLNSAVANSPSPIAYSWSELKTLVNANLSEAELRDTYGIEVGDYKEVNGVKYVLVDRGEAYGGFVFMYKHNTSLKMNSTDTNAGGYAASELAPQVEALYTNLADSELKSAIKQVTITCNDGKANYTATHTYTAHMFLASSKEVGFTGNLTGTYADGYNAEGTCFDLFTADDSSRTGFMSTANISSRWWLRSASSNITSTFYSVNAAGSSGTNYASYTYMVVPAFVIG